MARSDRADRPQGSQRTSAPTLDVRSLNVFYGASHALQGVDLTLTSGALSVVGRNGMGKTTLCRTIMGLVPAASGSIRFLGEELRGRAPAEIARLGIGYVPQGRRLWRSLTVDEHLRMVSAGHSGSWSIERIYSTFPRLAERRGNGGGQLSGGEQQMLAISRALLLNPRLLIMDEPTEGLAPVIVELVEALLVQLTEDEDIDILVIEQNSAVATAVAPQVAIMVNGRVNRIIDANTLAADRDLQQRLLGVGRHAHDDTPMPDGEAAAAIEAPAANGPTRIYVSNPKTPHRWSKPVPVRLLEQTARIVSHTRSAAERPRTDHKAELRPLASTGQSIVLVAGTLDTKAEELRFVRDIIRAKGLPARLVDLSTTGGHSGAEVPAHQVAAFHPRGASGVFTGDRGTSVAGMTMAFERWIARQPGVAGIIGLGGSGGTAMIAPAMRALAIGVPKIMVSTVASGDVRRYVGPSDMMMMYSIADIQGLNSITRRVLRNAADALAGMVSGARDAGGPDAEAGDKPAIGLTMFGVTTPCVQQVQAELETDYDCLVFHATGIGGQSMERLVEAGFIQSVIDITTTEVGDMMMGGAFPATEDRFGAIVRTRVPYIGSCGALDMVNFASPDTVPEKYRGRRLYEHNPQITLMRTTPQENAAIGRWIGERLNQMTGPVRFFIPEKGVSQLDQPGQPFHDPAADAALFDALETTVTTTSDRQLIRVPYNINDPEFSAELVRSFRILQGDRSGPPRPSTTANRPKMTQWA